MVLQDVGRDFCWHYILEDWIPVTDHMKMLQLQFSWHWATELAGLERGKSEHVSSCV